MPRHRVRLNPQKLMSTYSVLSACLWLVAVSLGLTLTIAIPGAPVSFLSGALTLSIPTLVLSMVAYFTALGVLVHRLHEPWIRWVGLSVVAGPVGVIASYMLARKRLHALVPPY